MDLSESSSQQTLVQRWRIIDYNDPEYESELELRGIYEDEHGPANRAKLVADISKPRMSPELSDHDAVALRTIAGSAVNDCILTSAVVPVIVKLHKLLLADRYFGVAPGAVWHDDPLPCRQYPRYQLSAPNPDLTVGYSVDAFPFAIATAPFNTSSSPAMGQPRLLLPFFTMEASCRDSRAAHFKNCHNAAVMLRNMRSLHAGAGFTEASIRKSFDLKARVLTATITTDIIELCCHWTAVDRGGFVEYHSRVLQKWAHFDINAGKDAVQHVRNALDWAWKLNRDWIENDLESIQVPSNPLKEEEKAAGYPEGSARRPFYVDDDEEID
jgi:hypothetical protein